MNKVSVTTKGISSTERDDFEAEYFEIANGDLYIVGAGQLNVAAYPAGRWTRVMVKISD